MSGRSKTKLLVDSKIGDNVHKGTYTCILLIATVVSQLGNMICLTQEADRGELQGISHMTIFHLTSDDILSLYYLCVILPLY